MSSFYFYNSKVVFECCGSLQEVLGMDFHITQPGSSVATSLIDGESKAKHVLLLEIKVPHHYLSSFSEVNIIFIAACFVEFGQEDGKYVTSDDSCLELELLFMSKSVDGSLISG